MYRLRLNERGTSLVEVLVAMAVLSFIGIAFIGSQFLTIQSNELSRNRISAESLARSELEFVKASPYIVAPWSYTLPGSPPSWAADHNGLPHGYDGYVITVMAQALPEYDNNIQKLTAIILYQGKQVMTLSAYKAN